MQRAIDAAQQRNMTIEQIEKATGIGSTTFYRWRDGKWARDPVASSVRNFCTGLGVSISEAYRALGWSEDAAAREPEPIVDDPDVRAVMRALNDPNLHPTVKLMIRRQLRALAAEAERTDE